MSHNDYRRTGPASGLAGFGQASGGAVARQQRQQLRTAETRCRRALAHQPSQQFPARLKPPKRESTENGIGRVRREKNLI